MKAEKNCKCVLNCFQVDFGFYCVAKCSIFTVKNVFLCKCPCLKQDRVESTQGTKLYWRQTVVELTASTKNIHLAQNSSSMKNG